MATLEEMIRGFGTVRSSEADIVADPDDDDSVWKHELRLPGPGETIMNVWEQAMEYRARQRARADCDEAQT